MVNSDLVGVEPTCSRWFRCGWTNYSDLSQGHPQKYGSARGTIPKCPRNSGYLRITVICPRICLLLLIYCTFFWKSKFGSIIQLNPLPLQQQFCHNVMSQHQRTPSPVSAGARLSRFWLAAKNAGRWVAIGTTSGCSKARVGKIPGVWCCWWNMVCVQPWQRIYMAFFSWNSKGTPQYHLHTKKYGLIKGLLTTIMPQYGPSKALFPGWGTALVGGCP